jgi:Putative beta-barrel porin-2, OmpL-like. bbp2
MKKFFQVLCAAVLLAGAAAMVTPAFAEDAKPKGLSADEIKQALGMSIYLQGGYTYNGNATTNVDNKGEENDLRIFDHKANSFGLDLAQVIFFKDAAVGTPGFKVKLSAGETAKFIHSAGMVSSAGDDPFDVTEAYMSYVAPVGKGLRFDFGKMGTFIGAEVIEAKDDPNYSRSFLFNYAEPLTHTGLKTSYNFTDTFNAALFIVNGWDNATDNNKGKSVGVSLGFTPADAFSGSLNVLTGPEQDNSNNKRTLCDVVATIKPVKKLSFILNYDYGYESKVTDAAGTYLGGVHWDGISGIAKYDISDKNSAAIRGEYFDDKDGARTGTAQKLKEVTLTWETKLDGGIIVRPEYRHDMSNVESFDNNTKQSQDTLALGVMYNW